MTDTLQATSNLAITRWRPGEPPVPVAVPDLDHGALDAAGQDAGGIHWIDLGPACATAGSAQAPGLLRRLAPFCRGQLDQSMLADLLTCGTRPEEHRYREGLVRLFVGFSVETREVTQADPDSGTETLVKMAIYQPVAFLAGDGWLITCWYPRRGYEGAMRISPPFPPGAHHHVMAAVARRWPRAAARTSGDLGVLVLDELALSFAPAHRTIYDWLEAWELTLYLDTDPEDERGVEDRTTLPDLWGTMTTLRSWLNPLNRAGMRADIDKAWFPGCEDHAAVNEVNDRIDRSLAALRDLGTTLRSSFGLLHIQLAEEQHRRTERLQNLIEYVTAAVLIPALVVGFYGANTALPGAGTWWGFWVMIAVMVVLGTGALLSLRALRGRTDSATAAAINNRERARAGLLPELTSGDS
jgi:CorA-like Mg2+ transporter protein